MEKCGGRQRGEEEYLLLSMLDTSPTSHLLRSPLNLIVMKHILHPGDTYHIPFCDISVKHLCSTENVVHLNQKDIPMADTLLNERAH